MCRGTTPYKEAEAGGALETVQLSALSRTVTALPRD